MFFSQGAMVDSTGKLWVSSPIGETVSFRGLGRWYEAFAVRAKF